MEWFEAKQENINRLVTLAWECYQNPLTRFYPIVSRKEDLQTLIQRAFDEQTLWVIKDKEDFAILPLWVDHEGRYVQANGGVAAKQSFDVYAHEFTTRLFEHYPGYTYFVGYPSSNTAANHYHHIKGDPLVDQLIRYEYPLESTVWEMHDTVGMLQDEVAFITFHNQRNPDSYWTAERMLENRGRWVILVDKTMTSSVSAMIYQKGEQTYAEIYALNLDDYNTALLESLLYVLKERQVERVVFLVDADAKIHQAIIKHLGFQHLDDYCGYRKELIV